MKKLILFFACSCFLYAGYSQSPRLVMLEEFTSATCGPCVSKNAQFHTWQTQNPDKFTSIYYHVNWPVAGDPMNLDNPGEASTRVSYYMAPTNMYVPYSVLDGNYYNGSAGGWNMATIDNRLAVPSPFEIQLQHQVSTGQDTVFSTILVKCTQNVSASMTAHNVIIEKWIHFAYAPCASSNGERDFYNVMKKMLPGSGGTTLPLSMVTGDYVLIEGMWKVGTVYSFAEVASVGFVQDKGTKEIYQTANSSAGPLTLPYNNDLQVLDVVNIPPKTCNNNLSPQVRIRNNGSNPVTSMTVKYKINDGALNSFTWNGNLGSMQKTVVTLPGYLFDLLPQNKLTVYSTDPNNTSDQYPKNDTLEFNFTPAPLSTAQIKVAIRTDNSPQETTWEIKNSLDVVVASGGPYPEANKLYQQTYTMPQADCYSFTIKDTGGNGICCSNGNGGYEVSSNGATIKQGGSFGYSELSEFRMEAPVSVSEVSIRNPLIVYPNPMDGPARVSFYMKQSGDVQMSLYSAFGQLVNSRLLGYMNAGQHTTKLDNSNLQPGVYILQVNTGTEVYSRKVSVIK
ncbi:MAG: T9SS type A sorting domain-containing protein [Bacteroidales bacterium]|nr:T9SS type A sorting domain-containing protein [Bacteroidales bacterium]